MNTQQVSSSTRMKAPASMSLVELESIKGQTPDGVYVEWNTGDLKPLSGLPCRCNGKDKDTLIFSRTLKVLGNNQAIYSGYAQKLMEAGSSQAEAERIARAAHDYSYNCFNYRDDKNHPDYVKETSTYRSNHPRQARAPAVWTLANLHELRTLVEAVSSRKPKSPAQLGVLPQAGATSKSPTRKFASLDESYRKQSQGNFIGNFTVSRTKWGQLSGKYYKEKVLKGSTKYNVSGTGRSIWLSKDVSPVEVQNALQVTLECLEPQVAQVAQFQPRPQLQFQPQQLPPVLQQPTLPVLTSSTTSTTSTRARTGAGSRGGRGVRGGRGSRGGRGVQQ